VVLGDIVPLGNPFLADAGHNGYTWEGTRRNYNLNLEALCPDKSKRLDRELLMSAGFIGSSSHVYVPMVDVVVDKDKKKLRKIKLPPFMLHCEDHFREAIYDVRKGGFVPLREAEGIAPQNLKLLSSPTQKSKYIKNKTLASVAHHFFNFNEYNYQSGALIGTISLVGAGIAGLTKMIAFRGMNMSSFEEQVCNYFTFKGQLLRYGTKGYNGYGWITRDQIENFSYATISEIEDGVRALEGEKWQHIDRKLNCFLLYKAFEKNEGSQGSFIVGEIVGDSHTLHLSYVPVGLR